VKQGAGHNQEFSPFDKACLKKIDWLVFELCGFKERTTQTKTVKTAKMSSAWRE
jgi:hypothetical protein